MKEGKTTKIIRLAAEIVKDLGFIKVLSNVVCK